MGMSCAPDVGDCGLLDGDVAGGGLWAATHRRPASKQDAHLGLWTSLGLSLTT